MKKNYKLLLILPLLLFISSCGALGNLSNGSESNLSEFEGYYEIEEGLYVNYKPGIYKEGLELEFKVKDKSSKVYYTLNCNSPTEKSKLYSEPISVNSKESNLISDYPLTISVDGILSWDNGGKMQSQSYINNIQSPQKYNFSPLQSVITINYIDGNGNSYIRSLSYIFGDYDIPVISLSMPYTKWFGTTGIYNNIRTEYEERANFEYFDPEYNESFYINTQVKLGGNYTVGYPQRILNLNFNKDENGKKQEPISAYIFKDRDTQDGENKLTNFSRLRLHTGGNCFENYTGFNDAILQELMTGTNVSTTGYRPCIVYLNGEYWGLYYLREHYKSIYFETNYGIDRDEVAIYDYKGEFIFNDGDDSDFATFFNEINTFLDKDFRNDNVYYEFIEKYIDVDSFIDVMIAHAFTCNRDYVGNNNNLKAWRATKIDNSNYYADGKLRFCLHDADFAFTDASYWNFLDPDVTNSYSGFKMFRKLLKNENFKNDFYNRAEELVETNLSYENTCEVIDRMVDEVKKYRLEANYRWGLYCWGQEVNGINKVGLDGWLYEILYAKNFVNTRINDTEEGRNENGNENERNFLEAIFESLKEY